MKINLLDKHTSELIAAGEVVERPASVVKELVENSVDAGATKVTVELVKNGISSIRVTDNGCGVASEDVPTAFLRHATSKISSQSDLERIETLGFRGEALPSIASVSRVVFLSKTPGAVAATRLELNGGERVSLGEAAGPEGTTVVVNDIFYNTPARMKFLKKDVSEGNAVQTVLEQQALAHPEVAFKLVRDSREVLSTPGDGKLFSAAFSLLPRELCDAFIPVCGEQRGMEISGYICLPQAARASRGFQYFFVNGRFVKNKTVIAAAEEAYRSLARKGAYPAYVLMLKVDPFFVDVNVHPAKIEVRFTDERAVFTLVYATLKAALFEKVSEPAAAKNAQNEPDFAVGVSQKTAEIAATKPKVTAESEPASSSVSQPTFFEYSGAYRGDELSEWDILGRLRQQQESSEPAVPEQRAGTGVKRDTASGEEQAAPAPPLRVCGELFSTYIIAELGERAFVIDKHAAHERLLFERFSQLDVASQRQQLLEPLSVLLGSDEADALLQNADVAEKCGFAVEDFGRGSVIVRAIPAFMSAAAARLAIIDIARQLADNKTALKDEKTAWLFQSLACRAAVKAGDRSSSEELLALAQQIIFGWLPKFCPHGRPVYYELSEKEIEKKFGRL